EAKKSSPVARLTCGIIEVLGREGRLTNIAALGTLLIAIPLAASAQPAITIDLKDAIPRARRYGGPVAGANIAAQLAREDTRQAKAAALPSLNAFNQFIYTEGNGTPSGVFVA